METTDTGFVITDTEGRVLDANAEYVRLTGHSALSEIVGRHVTEWTAKHDLARNTRAFRQCVERGLIRNLEIDYVNGQGTTTPVEVNATAVQTAEGTRVIGLCRDITERKRLEARIRESAEQLRALSENLDEGMVFQINSGPDGKGRQFTYLSPAVERLHGLAAEDVFANSALLYDQIVTEDRALVQEREARAYATRSTLDLDVRVRLPSGEVRWRRFLSSPRALPDGTVAWDGIELDITERKRTEEALAVSEAKYRRMHESMTDAFVRVDMSGRIDEFNRAYREMLGYSEDELPRFTYAELTPERWHAMEVRITEEQILKRGFSDVYEKEYRRKDGTVFPVELRTFLLTDDGGRPTGMWAIVRDITERKRTENALRTSEQQYRETLENMHLIAVTLDTQGRITFCNEFLLRLTGWSRYEVLGRNWFEVFLPPIARHRVREAFFDAMRRGTIMPHYENEIQTRSGARHLVSWNNTILRDVSGHITGTVSIGEDITEKKHAEEERARLDARLREAQKLEALGRSGRGVAHDFNNLMATVLGLASNMRADRQPGDPDHAKLTQIEEAADAAGKLAHQLLTFAKGGKIRLRRLPFGDVVGAALALLPPMVPRHVVFELRVAADLWQVECDQTQVQQVIVNLCRNAIEAMPHGGTMIVRAENFASPTPPDNANPPLPPGEYARLSVEDSGCGIDAEIMAMIFDPFVTTKEQGHGLGLAAAYGIMASHGGGISIISEPGKGSTFSLWLPRAAPPQ